MDIIGAVMACTCNYVCWCGNCGCSKTLCVHLGGGGGTWTAQPKPDTADEDNA
jgi:hypothetical protein